MIAASTPAALSSPSSRIAEEIRGPSIPDPMTSELRPDDPPPTPPDEVVFETANDTALAIAESLLREAEIPCTVRQIEGVPSSGWGGGYRMYGTALRQIRTRPEDADDARALLADLAAPDSPQDAGEADGAENGSAIGSSPRFSVYQGRAARRALWIIAITMLMFAVLVALAQLIDFK